MAHRLDIRWVKNSLRSGSSTISSRDDGSPRPSTSSAPTYTGSHRYEHSSTSIASSARTRKGSDSPQVHKVTSRTLLSSPEPPSSPHKTEPPIPPFPTLLTVQARGRPRVSSHSFDLSPPPPKPVSRTTEGLAERLYSANHLRLILEDPVFSSRFTGFLSIYRPHCAAQLTQYLESQKARKAIEYANAIVAKLASSTPDSGDETVRKAAHIDTGFEQQGRKAFHGLVDEGLTSFLTRQLVDVVTAIMVREITGHTRPSMEGLVGGLTEVFCLTDPSLEDCPIVYASEEFYRTTQYGRDYVIGRNCRFLQGPRTHRPSVARLATAIQAGKEVCETVINYRRDGTPFLNLLMVAPLFDTRGQIRYFIGAQVDVTGLLSAPHTLPSFARLLSNDRLASISPFPPPSPHHTPSRPPIPSKLSSTSHPPTPTPTPPSSDPLKALRELSDLLSWQERLEIRARSHSGSWRGSSRDDTSVAGSAFPAATLANGDSAISGRRTRMVLRDEQEEGETQPRGWAGSPLSGRLPGVYQNYLLIRPAPTFRIVFVSPSLRIPGLLQSSLLDRIGGADHVREGLIEALEQGVPITARVRWLALSRSGSLGSGRSREGSLRSARDGGDGDADGEREREKGKTRWLCCTPLFGSDDRVGVWVVVMIEEGVGLREGGVVGGEGIGGREGRADVEVGVDEVWRERGGEMEVNDSMDAGLDELSKDVVADRQEPSKEEEWLGVKGEEPQPFRRGSHSGVEEEEEEAAGMAKKVEGATRARRREARVLEGLAGKGTAVGEGIWVKERGSMRVGSGMGRLRLRTERSLDGVGERVWREEFVA